MTQELALKTVEIEDIKAAVQQKSAEVDEKDAEIARLTARIELIEPKIECPVCQENVSPNHYTCIYKVFAKAMS